jgi:hypothetical protein
MIQQTSSEFGYSESEYFYGVRLTFGSLLNQTSNKNCKLDINRTTRSKDCDAESNQNRIAFLIFLPKERFGLAKALPHMNADVITKLLEADASKTEVNVCF